MSKIKILPEILSNKIAAGEVVERPASVVKELVENALDAGGTRIEVEVRQGGKSLIQVADNGMGMNHDDALLALERYATSKIYHENDLFSIRTLGFRGEALPSIASVSKFCLVSRDATSAAGTEILMDGGKIRRVSETGAPVGTLITIRNLFFNTPARRKFLKTVPTEMGHIADIFTRMALAWPQVRFKLLHQQKTVKLWPAVTDPFDRMSDVLGKETKEHLLPVDAQNNRVFVSGWISAPSISRSTWRGVFIYVNGRWSHSRIIRHAIFKGYQGRLMKGRFPAAVLFIKIPFEQVDVNVHPTKHEVRFANPQNVHALIASGIRTALDNNEKRLWTTPASADPTAFVSENRSTYKPGPAPGSSTRAALFQAVLKNPAQASISPLPSDQPTAEQQTLWRPKRFSDLTLLGQLHNTYIVCAAKEGLVLIDQHAAHERIVYEKLQKATSGGAVSSQRLLIPETLDLDFREAQALDKLIPELKKLGLEIEPFGGDTFVIKAVPALLAQKDIKTLVAAMAEEIADMGVSQGLQKSMGRCIELMACHSAIRANQPLSEHELKGLLAQLDACDHPSLCPHGRPTWIRWGKDYLEKTFKRVV